MSLPWSTKASLRGTSVSGPPWSHQFRVVSPSAVSDDGGDDPRTQPPQHGVPHQCSPPPLLSPLHLPPYSPTPNGVSEPVTPLEKLDWLQECQLTSNGELTVTERLATLLDSGQFADVTIRVGQGSDVKTFKAHRLLLATASQPLYKLMSTVQYGHADLNTFKVTDIEPEAFKNVLKFIYTDTVKIDSIVEAFALLKAGKKWNLKNMNTKTIEYLGDFLDEFSPDSGEKKNEIFDILMLSEPHSKELFEKCLNIVIKHAKDIIPCQGFLRLDDKTIRRLVGDPNFTFEDQLTLFESIRDWGMNQILLKGLSPAQLHPIIEDLLAHVDFSKIPDTDFMGTILPSDCLGRAEVIAFFMTRGMEIPRDMGFNNNVQGTSIVQQNGEVQDFKKVCRFKRGYRLPHKEINQEHELRFRVDKNVKLLGVGFGFLFSNTDMGVTVHCQGPWERVQWTDMVQTYCRVNFEKMKTADLRLMFTEPAKLEANHSYKILVRVTRMTSGSSEVELWGGKDGQPYIETENAKFYFIKAACDPKKDVDPKEMDTKQGMITELLYVLDDSPVARTTEDAPRRRRPQAMEHEEEEQETKKDDEESKSPVPAYLRRRPVLNTETDTSEVSSYSRRREPATGVSTTTSSTYRRWQPSTPSTESTTRRWATREKTPETRKTPDSASVSDNTPYFMRRRPSPAQEKPDTPSFLRSRASTTSSASTDSTSTPFGERRTRITSRPWSSRTSDSSSLPTPTASRYGSSTSTPSYLSRYSRESSASKEKPTYSSSTSDTTSTPSSSLYRRDSTTSSTPSYRRDSSLSRRESGITDSGSSLYKKDQPASVSSRYGRDSAISQLASRFGTRDSSATRYGSSSLGSSLSSGSSYGGSYGGSRYLGSSYSRFR